MTELEPKICRSPTVWIVFHLELKLRVSVILLDKYCSLMHGLSVSANIQLM